MRVKKIAVGGRDFSAKVRLTPKSSAASSAAMASVTPMAGWTLGTTAWLGQTRTYAQQAAEGGLSLGQYLSDLGLLSTDPQTDTVRAIVLPPALWYTGKSTMRAFCLAADPASIVWQWSWNPVVDGGYKPEITVEGGLLVVEYVTLIYSAELIVSHAGVLVLTAMVDGVPVQTLTLTLMAGYGYACDGSGGGGYG